MGHAGRNETLKSAVVFTCSGAADVGAITDAVGRRLARETGMALMSTVGVAAGNTAMIGKAIGADRVVCLDGCGERCAARVLEAHGIVPDTSIMLGDWGLDKGASPATPVRIEAVLGCLLEAIGEE